MSYEQLTQIQSRIIIGTKQTLRAMKNGDITEVYIAEDANHHVTQGVVELAEELHIPYTHVPSKKKLGRACGIDVGTSTVAIKKNCFGE